MDLAGTGRMKKLKKFSLARLALHVILGCSLVLMSGCTLDDPDDESGVVGTGIHFRGAVSEQKQLASRVMDIRSQLGDRSAVVIEEDGQYSVDTVLGDGPWLLRVDLGNDNFSFGIAYEAGIANVHSYSDVVLRSWFFRQYDVSDLNAAFDAEDALQPLPDAATFASLAAPFLGVVELVLNDYSLSGEQLFNEDFRNDDTGIDRFLDLNPVIAEGDRVRFVKTDPFDGVQSSTSASILLGGALGQGDTTLPSMPAELRALAGPAQSIVLVWEPSTDDSVVIGYEIVRNGELIDRSPYPVFTDENLVPGMSYTYEVRAIDLAGNISDAAVVVSAGVSSVVDTLAPPSPLQLTSVLASTQRVELVWVQNAINEVAGFNVYRGLEGGDISFLVRTSSTAFTDATTSAGLTYCYQVTALDASGNESERTAPLCVSTTGIVIDPRIVR